VVTQEWGSLFDRLMTSAEIACSWDKQSPKSSQIDSPIGVKFNMKRYHLLSGIIVSTIFVPWIPVTAGMAEIRPEWILLFVGIAFWRIKRELFLHPVVFLGFGVIAAYTITTIAVVIENKYIDYHDLKPFFAPLLYILFFAFIASEYYKRLVILKIMKITIVSMVVSCLITVMQYFQPELLEPLFYLYRNNPADMQSYKLVRSWGTMGNPNVMGFLAAVSFGVVLFLFKYRFFRTSINWLFLAITFLAVFATGSRTGIVCMMLILGYFYACEMKKNLKNVFAVSIIFISIILFFNLVIISVELFQSTVERILSLTAISEDTGGWIPRIEAGKYALSLVMDKPILGYGSSKTLIFGVIGIDNEYLLYSFQFGIIGLIIILIFIWAMATQIDKSISNIHQTMRNLSIALLCAAAIFAYTAGIYGSFQIMFLLIILWTFPAYWQQDVE